MTERGTRSFTDSSRVYDDSLVRGAARLPRLGALIVVNYKRLLWLLAVAVLGVGTYAYVAAPLRVHVAEVRTVDTSETIAATGKIRGERQTDLGVDLSGIVSSTYVREGDSVKAGDLILSVDGSDLQASVDISRAALASAQAELARISRPAQSSEIRQAMAELEQAQSVGRARVAQAQARLRDLKAGSRTQEVAAAQAELQRRKAVLDEAQNNYKRIQQLVKAGALAQAQLDSARTDLESARASYTAQQESVNMLKEGSRPAQLSEAQAALDEANASYRTSTAAARESLNTLLALPHPEDVAAARAKVDQARAELARASGVRSKTDMRAPFDGVVADMLVEKGQSVSPGQKLVLFQELSRPIIEVETDEDNLNSLSVGQQAVVSTDAYPGRTFDAVLYDLGSKVNSDRGTIIIKLRPKADVNWLRSDMTVDVNLITKEHARRIILPVDCVTHVAGKTSVLVVDHGKAVAVPVKAGAAGPEGVVIDGKLTDGMLVVRNAVKVDAGSDVSPVRG